MAPDWFAILYAGPESAFCLCFVGDDDAKDIAGFVGELLGAGGELAQEGQGDAAELAARDVEPVRDIGRRDAELGGDLRLRRRIVVGEVKAPEQLRVHGLAATTERVERALHG